MKSPRTIIILQARMSSTRLPGKVLRSILHRPMLLYQLQRLQRVLQAHDIVVATSTEPEDEKIVDLCSREGFTVTRGSLHDVLARYEEAARVSGADVIVRICSDCPLIDPSVVEEAIDYYFAHTFEWVGNFLTRRYPRGYEVEVFSAKALGKAHHLSSLPHEREHVTPFIYRNPHLFSIGEIIAPCQLSHHRWVVDTEEDFTLISKIFEALYPLNPHFATKDILALLEQKPHWIKINHHIKQKTLP